MVRQKLVFLLSSRYFSIIRASSCELVKSSTNENSDNIFCLFPPRGCRVSLITEQLSFTHHILLFVSSKKEGVLEMREKPPIRPLYSPYCVTDTQPASTFPDPVCKLKISSFLFPEADCSIFTLLGVIDITIPCRSLIFLLPFSFFSSFSSLSPPSPRHSRRSNDATPLLHASPFKIQIKRFTLSTMYCFE